MTCMLSDKQAVLLAACTQGIPPLALLVGTHGSLTCWNAQHDALHSRLSRPSQQTLQLLNACCLLSKLELKVLQSCKV